VIKIVNAPLDLYYLLVENVFGSVLLSGLGLVIFFIIIGMICKMSPMTIIILVGYFVGVFSIGYIGEIGALLLFIPAFMWFMTGLGKFIFRVMGSA